jgi:hypothetical protein
MFDGVNAQPEKPYELGYGDLADINREIAAASSVCAFERPARKVAAALKLPKAAASISRAAPMPLDDTGEGYLIRRHRPNRWAGETSAPPWPVERWFQRRAG